MKKTYVKERGNYYDVVAVYHGAMMYAVIHHRCQNNMCYGGTRELMSTNRKEIAKFIKKYR